MSGQATRRYPGYCVSQNACHKEKSAPVVNGMLDDTHKLKQTAAHAIKYGVRMEEDSQTSGRLCIAAAFVDIAARLVLRVR